ncbi:MAG: HAD hydrolase-like protein, partial [Flavobacteriaceae bacterium]
GWSAASQYDVLVTADDVQRGRPFPDMIWKAMDFLNIEVPQFVMKAGDSIIDIEEGKNAHCGLTVGVTTGAHTKSQLISALPTLVVRSLAELQPLIKGPV